MKYKILNGYAGIGGNRKLWGNDYEVTAVEFDPNIANVYQDLYKNDTVIVADMHEYLIKNYMNFDFIWLSPPCPSHSRMRLFNSNAKNPIYVDMTLYQEILFLKSWFKGKWIVENVIPYYEPLIKPNFELHRHFIWCNFNIPNREFETLKTGKILDERKFLEDKFDFDLTPYVGIDKRKVLRNCVVPEMGLHILNSALYKRDSSTPSVSLQNSLFDFA